MVLKVVCAAIVIIPTWIAVLIFYIAHALFAAPGVLLGEIQAAVAVLCVVAGILLLLPALIVLLIAVVNYAGRRKESKVCPLKVQ